MSDFAQWVLDLVKQLIEPIWNFLTDFLIAFVELVFQGIVALVSALPGMGWANGGLQAFYGGLHPGVAYVCDQLGVPAGLGLVGAAFLFRLGRKVVTLFQW